MLGKAAFSLVWLSLEDRESDPSGACCLILKRKKDRAVKSLLRDDRVGLIANRG